MHTFINICYPHNSGGLSGVDDYFRQYGLIGILVIVSLVIPISMLMGSRLLSWIGIRPALPDSVKQSIYECGFDSEKFEWNQYNFRFYTFALLFVVFDLEVVFLFPWAVAFGVLSLEFGLFILIEMIVFIVILMVGWIYAWRNNDLKWE